MITKEQIANAFERHFHHFGFRKTSVDDVARELKISKKTIYAVFSSKEEILHYLVSRSAATLLSGMKAALAALPDDAARLQALVGMIFDQALEFHRKRDPLDFKMDIVENAYRKAYQQFIQDVLAAGMASGTFPPAPIPQTTALLDGLISAGLHLAVECTDASEIPTVVFTTTRAVMKVVG